MKTSILNTLVASSFVWMIAAGAAWSDTVEFEVTNNFGADIELDTDTCSSGSIFPPSTISNNDTEEFDGTAAGTTLCSVRYEDPTGTYGCLFQVQTFGGGGFASAGPYKGTGTSPECEVLNEGPVTGGYRGEFEMTN